MAVALLKTKTPASRWLDIGRKKVSGAPEIGPDVSIRYRDDRFRLLVEAVRDYAIFLLDSEGRIATWNSGAERIKGYGSDEVIGRNFSMFYPDADLHATKRQLDTARKLGRFEGESWCLRKDGSKFWAGIVITPLRDSAGSIYGFAKVTHDLSERKAAEEALRKSLNQLRTEIEQRMEAEKSVRNLSAQLLRLQDEERRRLGQELHDGVGQLLSGVKMCLGQLASTSGTVFDGHLADCKRLIDEAISEVRTVSYLLYPPMLEEMGLKSAAEWHVDGFRQRSGIRVTFTAPANLGRLARDIELVLFRVLQESLTNVHRHSGSTTAHVALKIENGAAILEVQDQGKGIAATARGTLQGTAQRNQAGDAFGVGLRGMKERVHHVGGTLDLISSSKGTTVRASVPVVQSPG